MKNIKIFQLKSVIFEAETDCSVLYRRVFVMKSHYLVIKSGCCFITVFDLLLISARDNCLAFESEYHIHKGKKWVLEKLKS